MLGNLTAVREVTISQEVPGKTFQEILLLVLLTSYLGLHQCPKYDVVVGLILPFRYQYCHLLNRCEYVCRLFADIYSVLITLTHNMGNAV